ncbi:SDR family NAD(P)-dependent oxidoreductase [Streptomyces sp. NBC_00249]|uniref:SDR family NAD(P)-dependent oxidoreductase n=1 Tax=Streptomyces sp. NBC_00249 TaxID=2975690 RepID=UPI002257C8D1|nr:SDR family NAD(P)-dependent oxidoreductase [Streptomyces sp. NBC_00249]MCX5195685.1 SDR family NAD(P)-dependent oxidoreductase [Streptomyces sp. NBC_00249]
MGCVTARELARHGAHVVLAARNTDKGRAALDRLPGELPESAVELRSLDLADLDSVHTFADALDTPVDVLVNNAGIWHSSTARRTIWRRSPRPLVL